VTATVKLFAAIERPHTEIPLLNPAAFGGGAHEEEDACLLHNFLFNGEHCLILRGSKGFHLMREKDAKVMATCGGLRGILDLAVASEVTYTWSSIVLKCHSTVWSVRES